MEHDHPHRHDDPPADRHRVAEPTGQHGVDTLVLDIGGDIGALNIVTGADRNELEIEISPLDADSARRTHNVVHARRVGSRTVYAAVFPSVRAGDYVVWHDESTPAGTVTVLGGQVTSYHLI